MIETRVWCSWNIRPRRNLNDWEIEEMRRLMDTLEKSNLGDRVLQDERIWSLNEKYGFLIKFMYATMCILELASCPSNFIWNTHIPSKVAFFMWLLWWNHAPMVDNLTIRGLIIPKGCCMCMLDGESTSHLFIHCSSTAGLWNFFLVSVGVPWVQPAFIRDLFHCWPLQSLLDSKNTLGKVI